MFEPGEQCINKSCGEDATRVVLGDAFCETHAEMALARLNEVDETLHQMHAER